MVHSSGTYVGPVSGANTGTASWDEGEFTGTYDSAPGVPLV